MSPKDSSLNRAGVAVQAFLDLAEKLDASGVTLRQLRNLIEDEDRMRELVVLIQRPGRSCQ